MSTNSNGGDPGDQNQNNNNPPPKNDDSGNQNGKGGEGNGGSEITSLEEANKIIAALRKENASRRTTNKSLEDSVAALTDKLGKVSKHLGLEDEEADPEEVIQGLTTRTSQLEMELAITQMARANNIPVEHDDYFRFLVQKRMGEWEEQSQDGEELPEDFFQNVAQEVSQYGGGGQQRKSIGAGDGGKKPPANNGGGVSVEQFAALSFADKAAMKQKDPQEYARLFNEAVAKRLIK